MRKPMYRSLLDEDTPAGEPIELAALVDQLADERPLRVITIKQYQAGVAKYSKWLRRKATTADLRYDLVNKYLRYLEGTKLMPRTVLNFRKSITVVWNYASSFGLCTWCNPYRLRRVKVAKPIVKVWRTEELRRLLAAAEELPGQTRTGIPINRMMVAFLLALYDSGARPIDVTQFRFDQLDGDRITFVQSKTLNVHTAVLRKETLEAIKRTVPPGGDGRERMFPIGKYGLRRYELIIREASGLMQRLRGFGQLRKSHATLVAEQYGIEAAAASLGHVSGLEVARTHYIEKHRDYSIMPPPLVEPNGQDGDDPPEASSVGDECISFAEHAKHRKVV